MLSFARASIVRVRYPVDEVGEHDFAATPDEVSIPRCSVQPGASIEVLDGGERVRVSWVVYAPLDSDVLARDFVRVSGQLCRVVGEPESWNSGLRVDHKAIYLERWEG